MWCLVKSAKTDRNPASLTYILVVNKWQVLLRDKWWLHDHHTDQSHSISLWFICHFYWHLWLNLEVGDLYCAILGIRFMSLLCNEESVAAQRCGCREKERNTSKHHTYEQTSRRVSTTCRTLWWDMQYSQVPVAAQPVLKSLWIPDKLRTGWHATRVSKFQVHSFFFESVELKKDYGRGTAFQRDQRVRSYTKINEYITEWINMEK